MSAFLVNPEHIQQLCAFHKAISPQDHAARPTAKILAVGNLNSIKARYRERWAEFLGDMTVDQYLRECGRGVPYDMKLTTPDIAAMLHCYEYQACEVNPWERSDAWYICQALRMSITRRLMDKTDVWEYRPGVAPDNVTHF